MSTHSYSSVFGSFGNEPMQSCSVRRVSLSLSSWSVSSASASVYSPPVTALIIETSYLANICSYTLVYAHEILGQ